VCVADNPFLLGKAKPKNEDTKSNYRQDYPKKPLANKSSAGAVEPELLSVEMGMLCKPTLFNAKCPRQSDKKRKECQ